MNTKIMEIIKKIVLNYHIYYIGKLTVEILGMISI